MKIRAIVGVALTGGVILVSCTQDRTSAPSLPTEASLARTSNTCDFTIMRADAKDYFALLKDPVYAKIDLMQDAYKASGITGTTTTGYDVLAQTAANVKDASKIKGTPAQGSAFVNDVFKCMSVAGYAPSIDFSMALGAFGLFDVVYSTIATPVYARYYVGDSPAFGAEPTPGSNWPVTGPTLFYGWKETVTSLADETPKGTVAEIKTLPVYSSFSSYIRAGACKVTDAAARPLHLHGIQATILAPVLMSFCSSDEVFVGSASTSRSGFRYAMHEVASWLAPRPLMAAMPTFAGGGGAGLVDGLSEIGPVSYTSVVSFTVPPGNTTLSASPQFSPTVTVTDTTSNGNPLKDVLITLTVVGNNGSYNISGNTARTNQYGIATFPNLYIDKAGGYTVTATSEVGGSAQAGFTISGL